MRKLMTQGLFAIALVASLESQSAPLFDDMANPNVLNGAIIVGNEMAAADFQIDDLGGRGIGELQELRFWTLMLGGASWAGTVDYFIWEDDGSPTMPQPDLSKLVASGSLTGADVQIDVGSFSGFPQWSWTVPLDNVVLQTPTTYWLGLNMAGSTGIFWQNTTNTFGTSPARHRLLPGTTWDNTFYAGDVAFELNGAPLPQTPWLVGGGLVALAYARRRRRAT